MRYYLLLLGLVLAGIGGIAIGPPPAERPWPTPIKVVKPHGKGPGYGGPQLPKNPPQNYLWVCDRMTDPMCARDPRQGEW